MRLVVQPGLVLQAGRAQLLQFFLGLLRWRELGEVGLQPILLRHEQGLAQQALALRQVLALEGQHDRVGCDLRRLGLLGTEGAGAIQPAPARGLAVQAFLGAREAGEARKALAEGLHRFVHHAVRVRHRELEPLGQRGLQCLERVEAAMRRDRGFVVGAGQRIALHRRAKAAPYARDRLLVVFPQLEARGQAERLQHGHRRFAHQRGEPAVEGADLHRPAGLQQRAIERTKRFARAGVGLRHAAGAQCLGQFGIGRAAPLGQPFLQPLPHLAGRLAGEGDGEDLLWLGTVEQRAQDARDQHPGLACTGAGLHRDVAPRVAGDGIELLALDRAAVVLVGRFGRQRVRFIHSRHPFCTGRGRGRTRTRALRRAPAAVRRRPCGAARR